MGCELLMSDGRRDWGSVPSEIHKIAVDEYDKTGAIPPAGVLSELTGIGRVAVTRALKQLMAEGLIAQPHGERAPYVPLFRPDGTRVRPVLVEVGKEAVVQEEPKSTAELLEEVARRVRELEGGRDS